MKFYYNIKFNKRIGDPKIDDTILDPFGSKWQFPPAYQGFIDADTKEEAKKLIEAEYEEKFPLRVKKSDDNARYLLSLKEIKDDSYELIYLETHTCKACGCEFKLIDKYRNDEGGSTLYCSKRCYELAHDQIKIEQESLFADKGFIYKIRNKKSDMCYIGQTLQLITLRWYQHIYQSGDTKFHKELKMTKLEDWEFSILKEINFNSEEFANAINEMFSSEYVVKEIPHEYRRKYLTSLESKYIKEYDSVENGYNSAYVKIP